jgi:hypothetical protein
MYLLEQSKQPGGSARDETVYGLQLLGADLACCPATSARR